MKRILLTVLAVLAAGSTGSATFAAGFTLYGKVTSYADGTPTGGQRYVLTRTADPSGTQSLEFKELAAFLRKALAEHNISETTDPADASLVIDFNFGTDSRLEQQSVPQYGTVGVKTKIETNPFTGQVTTKNKQISGVTGYATESKTLYRRWITVKAFDASALRTSKTLAERWTVAAESEGETNDLRMMVPIIIYASRGYFGLSSGRAVEFKVVWKDKNKDAVAFLGAPPED